jgi:hypothetical protein
LINVYPNKKKKKKKKNNNNNKVKSKPLELFELAGKKKSQLTNLESMTSLNAFLKALAVRYIGLTAKSGKV